MELFNRLFGSLLVFIYHCFDRIVINGYLSMLSRPEQVVYFFKEVLGIEPITKEVLGQRTKEYQAWVEAYARNQGIPLQWAEKKVLRKIMSCLGRKRYNEDSNTESILFSRAWNRDRPSVLLSLNTQRPILIIVFSRNNALGLPITISISWMKFWDPWLCG